MDNNLNDYRKKLKNIHDISRELFVKQFSASLNEIFKRYLSELLNGKSWNVEPFDWEPYK